MHVKYDPKQNDDSEDDSAKEYRIYQDKVYDWNLDLICLFLLQKEASLSANKQFAPFIFGPSRNAVISAQILFLEILRAGKKDARTSEKPSPP